MLTFTTHPATLHILMEIAGPLVSLLQTWDWNHALNGHKPQLLCGATASAVLAAICVLADVVCVVQ